MKIQLFVCAVMCAALGAPSVFAEPVKPVKLTDAEIHVIAHVHAVNQMEIKAGKLAQKKATRAGIKDYGAMLVKDHTQNDHDVMALAKTHGQKIPADTPMTEADKQDATQDKDAMDQLNNMRGSDFDREFLRTMVAGHDKMLSAVDIAVGQATSPDVVQFLKDTKPTLKKHADTARDLQKQDAQAANP